MLDGNGMGGFAAARTFAAGMSLHGLATADFDGDMNLDVAVANNISGTGTFTVLRGNGAGMLTLSATVNVNEGPLFVTTGDLNGDARPDLNAGEAY